MFIPREEIRYRTSRSSGPGGQHANKASTRVTLMFDVAGSPSLSPEQRKRILKMLGTRISKEGVLRISSQRFRSQKENKRAALRRFHELISEALKGHPLRRPTQEPMWAKQRRLQQKRIQGMRKRERSKRFRPDEE
jgi:ribosome-associated protein